MLDTRAGYQKQTPSDESESALLLKDEEMLAHLWPPTAQVGLNQSTLSYLESCESGLLEASDKLHKIRENEQKS